MRLWHVVIFYEYMCIRCVFDIILFHALIGQETLLKKSIVWKSSESAILCSKPIDVIIESFTCSHQTVW